MDERTNPRMIVDTTFKCIIGQNQHPLYVYNLSRSGCMFVTPVVDLHIGDCMEIKFSDSIETTGQIVWMRCGNAGLKFDNLLHEATVRHYGFVPDPVDFEDWEPHDQFGRLLPALPPVGRATSIQLPG